MSLAVLMSFTVYGTPSFFMTEILRSMLSVLSLSRVPDFQAPPPLPKFIDTGEALDAIPYYDSFDPAPDDF